MKLIDKIKYEHNEFTSNNQLKLNKDIDMEKIYNNEVQYEEDICEKSRNVIFTSLCTGVAGAVLCLVSLPVGAIVGGLSIIAGGAGNYFFAKPHKMKPIIRLFNKTKGTISDLRQNILELTSIIPQLEEACDNVINSEVQNTQEFLQVIEEKRAIIKECFNYIEEDFLKLRKLKKNEEDIKQITELITTYTKCKLYIDEYEDKYENAIKQNAQDKTLNHAMLNNGIDKIKETYPLKEFSFQANKSNDRYSSCDGRKRNDDRGR